MVDLATTTPRAGTYTGADPTGLIWSLQPPPGHDPRSTEFNWYTKEPLPITLTAEVKGGRTARQRLVRRQVADGVTGRPLREQGLVGALCNTAPRRPRPTVLVLGGSNSALPEATAALLASHGYAALGSPLTAAGPTSRRGHSTASRPKDAGVHRRVRRARSLRLRTRAGSGGRWPR